MSSSNASRTWLLVGGAILAVHAFAGAQDLDAAQQQGVAVTLLALRHVRLSAGDAHSVRLSAIDEREWATTAGVAFAILLAFEAETAVQVRTGGSSRDHRVRSP